MAAGLIGMTPDAETRASTRTSWWVTGMTSSSIICTGYASATAKSKEEKKLPGHQIKNGHLKLPVNETNAQWVYIL